MINNASPEGPPANISAGDGSPSALMRIRYKSYQKATIPEPLILQGWQLVDELNRAMQDMPPSGYQTPPAILTKDNTGVPDEGLGLFDPDSDYRGAYRRIWMGK